MKNRNPNKSLTRQWTFLEYDALGQEEFDRLSILLLRREISQQVHPTNKKGPDYSYDAFLSPCDNNYKRNGLWWFEFKFKEIGRAGMTRRNPKNEFKKDFLASLEKIVEKKQLPETFLILTNVELTGKEFAEWKIENIDKVYCSKIPFIECWDYSKLNSLLDEYSDVKQKFNELIFGSFSPSPITQLVKKQKLKLLHLLQKPDVRFIEKLNYIIDLISNFQKQRTTERKQALDIIKNNNILSWHFLKNLKNQEWFPLIKNNIIKSVIRQGIDTSVKYQLLSYFETCVDQYSDEIIPLLAEFEKNTRDPNILSAFIRTIGKLSPSKKENLRPIWKILNKLTEHQHPWVRREIPKTLKNLIQYDIDKVLKLLEKLFLFNPIPQDVTQGWPTLALIFQGKDNENWVFEEAVTVLSELMSDNRYAIKSYDLAVKIEVHFIKKDNEKITKQKGIFLDYSCIKLADENPFGELKYKWDRKERLALEIEKSLDKFAESEKDLAESLFNKLLQARYEVFYLIIIKVTTRHANRFIDIIEKIIFDENLWFVENIRGYHLQLLIGAYFEVKRDLLDQFINKIENIKYNKNEKLEIYLQQDLLASIPDNLRSQRVKERLVMFEKEYGVDSKIRRPLVVTSWSGPRPDITIDELKKKTADELIQIMEDCTNKKRQTDVYDLSPLFEQLIQESPDQLPVLLDKRIGRKAVQFFTGQMMRGYIKAKRSNPSIIFETFWKLLKTDTWARKEVAMFIIEEYRKSETETIDKELFSKIKAVLFDMATDSNPENDEAFKSSHPAPSDAITRGINSIRGIAAEALATFAYYFPRDKDLLKVFRTLSCDSTNAVKATVIYNLGLLIKDNYPLCKVVINQFKNIRDPEIDFGLIRFFNLLEPRRFQANRDFIKLLFNNSNKEIQKELGELIGYKQLDALFNVSRLTEAIIKQQIGTAETRLSLAFVFESELGKLIEANRYRKICKYFIRLLDPFNEPDYRVREQGSFAFERDELKTSHFAVLDKSKVFDTILNDKLNLSAQKHLVGYLKRCIQDNQSIERCIKILHSQIVNIEGVLSDPFIVKDLVDIIERILENDKLSNKTKKLANEIFDRGLEKGWDEFYNLFEKIRKEENTSNQK